jgi:serine/threonine-protein kinase BUR1
MYKRKPILTGQSDLHQTQLIFELLGSPTSQTMPGWDTLPGAGPVMQMVKTVPHIDKAFKE